MRDMLQTRSYDAFFMFPYFSPSAQAMIEQEKNATAFISMYMSSTRQKKEESQKKTSSHECEATGMRATVAWRRSKWAKVCVCAEIESI